MDIRRLLHNPDDGGWYIIGETKSEAEMNELHRSLKRNAIININLVNCTLNHENDVDTASTEHKMKVQWTKCTSALCHPKDINPSNGSLDEQGKPRACPVQMRMSTCQLTFSGIICQAYQHLSKEHDSAEPLQQSVTEEMKTCIICMLHDNPEEKPMTTYKKLTALHEQGAFGADFMPMKIQLRNALTYLRSRKLKLSSGSGDLVDGTPRKRQFDSFLDGSEFPPLEEHRQPE
ncbi:unnamed protein product [Peronospora belbahrii]|uniref:Uncharacterized protein n=1 Tax=Peronospora belbahrii TaxID=622444 RepID=A0AAU9LB37_9STRA|nr:unnamed protein product [Peronospora belbahrii]CAH0518837.1 unnamed protein product [Peronospora belbahrii]